MIFEDFSSGAPISSAAVPTADHYDDGYRQGWADAAEKIRADDLRVGARVAAQLEKFSHTQSAAMSICLAQLEPLLTEIFDKLLPRAADRGFLALILQEAEAALSEAEGNKLTLRVAPDTVGPLRAYLEAVGADLTDYDILADPDLDPLQAGLSAPSIEREIDVGRLLDALDEAFASLTPDRSTQNG
ncbi:hypothetical protein [Jannaschia aquimarina]|uniref:Flagellar assembly protein FliH n=1 Tax=Jannaschia aquimarina TaxID=935700 RepID=A0A0D1E9H4_9RHOB|nr:hypothetical protein [Jannaschia aquimarina]KIT14284.1 hypothetical protein jaqu_40780 [Jannaschia aquimarina]SNS49991.1 flagellar assembly protein FliH [Jannaschia aquimarina]